MTTGIYDDPRAYELACAFRDIPAEVDALLRWSARHRTARTPPRSVLELAAGPAEHAREFAARGIEATALDLNPAMCAYAAERGAGLPLRVVRGDMAAFRLGRRFDLIITMLDSTAHLMTLDAIVAHLDRVAAHVATDGVYVLEMSHPADRLTARSRSSNSWRVARDGEQADVRWGEPDDVLDPITQIVADHVTITVTSGDATRVIRGVVPYRFWTATELEAAIRLCGSLEIAARYGDFADVGVDDPAAWRLITVLRPAAAQPGDQGVAAQPGIG
ncbi:MAG TPA: class I SAM-dependent methyltransferase [Streptosporangiaceae bacterium]|nr:class I SAM-dependent methyltransferase [Streptosporangiaceae bacterium]